MNNSTQNKIRQSNTSGNDIIFICHSCELELTAKISEIGQVMFCTNCESENEIPLPKINVGGGQRKNTQKPKKTTTPTSPPLENNIQKGSQVSPPIKNTATKTVIVKKKTTTSNAVNNEEKVNEENISEGIETEEIIYIIEENDENQEVKFKNKLNSIIPIVVLLCISIGTGWSAMAWGPQLLIYLKGPSSVVDTSEKEMITVIGPDQLQSIISFKRAAILANETIESDLKVTLAEMETLGMIDNANVVRRAITQKYTSIEEAQNRYIAVMIDIANAYSLQASDVQTLFENYLTRQTVRSDKTTTEFLQISLNSLLQLPSDKTQYSSYFAKKFETNQDETYRVEN